MKTIVFIENKEDIYTAEELYKNNQAMIIALGPEAAYQLEKRKIPHTIQDDYYSRGDYIEIGQFNFKRTEEFCNYCDNFLKNRIEFLNVNNLNVTFYHFFCFRTVFDAVISKIRLFKKIIEVEKPDNICFFDNDCEEEINETLYFRKKSPYSESLKILSEHFGINCKIYQTKNTDEQLTGSPITNYLDRKNLLQEIYRKIKKVHDGFGNKYENLPVAFMTFPCYDLFYVCNIIKKMKVARILSFDPESNREPHFIFPSWEKVIPKNYDLSVFESMNFEKIWRDILSDEKFREFFMFECISILPIIEKRLKYFFTIFVKNLIDLYLKGSELFAMYKPRIFFAPYMVRARMKVLAEAAKKNNIPIAVYQHGGVYGYTNYMINDDTEVQYCDYFIAFGNGVKQRYKDCHAEVIPVGSFILNKLRKNVTVTAKSKLKKAFGIEKHKKVVIYAMSPIYKSWKSIDYSYYTDHYCFYVQKKIIDVFSRYDNYEYILKIFPAYGEKDPIISYINDKKKENFKIIWNKSFKDILHCADLIVMDSPSTPLLESLAASKKIMVYDLYGCTFPDAVEVLRKRAYYSNDINEYIRELEKELKRGDFDMKNPDNEFSELYGKYDDFDLMNNNLCSFLSGIFKK